MEFLFRYTELPFLFYLLQAKRLTLLSPANWDDRNDSYFISEYQKAKKLKTVLALCFTEKWETYHHWRIFSGNHAGVCIVFYKAKFIKWLEKNDLNYGPVEYLKIRELPKMNLEVGKLPFLKRKGFEDEKEFRILYEDKKNKYKVKDFNLDLGTIKSIRVNPWLPNNVKDSVTQFIHDIEDCSKIKVVKSSLIDNPQWKEAGTTLKSASPRIRLPKNH